MSGYEIDCCAKEIEDYLFGKGFVRCNINNSHSYVYYGDVSMCLCFAFNFIEFPNKDDDWKDYSYWDPKAINELLIKRIFNILRKYKIERLIIFSYDNNEIFDVDPSIEYGYSISSNSYIINGRNIDYK